MEERRADMKELTNKIDKIVENQAIIKSYIEHQFGGIDLAGNKSEGVITTSLQNLNDKVKIQNGRIGKLEINHAMLTGALALITVVMPVIVFLIGRAWK